MAEGADRGNPLTGNPGRLPRPRGRLGMLARNERGTALVEFALVLPILLAITIAIADFGLALNYYNQLSQLAGQGARAAAVNCNPDGTCPVSGTSIQTQVAETYAKGGLNKKVSACILSTAAIGQPVTLTVTYQFHPIGFLPFLGSATLPITVTQSERQEVTPTYSTGCAS